MPPKVYNMRANKQKPRKTDLAAITESVVRSVGAEVPDKLFMAMYTVDGLLKEYERL